MRRMQRPQAGVQAPSQRLSPSSPPHSLMHPPTHISAPTLGLQGMGEARYQAQEDFRREISILRACRDPNVVAFLVRGGDGGGRGGEELRKAGGRPTCRI